jgi:hypothetical protein
MKKHALYPNTKNSLVLPRPPPLLFIFIFIFFLLFLLLLCVLLLLVIRLLHHLREGWGALVCLSAAAAAQPVINKKL